MLNYQIQTDGIGVSLSFIRNDLVDKKYGSKTEKIVEDNYRYIEDCNDNELRNFDNKNIVGCDPGKKFLTYMVDKNNNTLKYSSVQRRVENLAKRNSRILLTEKKIKLNILKTKHYYQN